MRRPLLKPKNSAVQKPSTQPRRHTDKGPEFKWDNEKSGLVLMKSGRKKKKPAILDLSAVSAALSQVPMKSTADAAAVPRRSDRIRATSKRGRKHLLQLETAHFKKILEHPAFRQNPSATLHQHIANSVPNKR